MKMNEYEKILRSAETTIKTAAIIRLFTDASMSLLLAYSCSKNIQFQVHEYGISILFFVIFTILADMIFTVLWQFSENFFAFHGIFYILFGIVFYGNCFGWVFIEAPIAERLGFDVLTVKLPVMGYATVAYIIGLIPFVIYKNGRRKMKKANRIRIRELMESGIDR